MGLTKTFSYLAVITFFIAKNGGSVHYPLPDIEAGCRCEIFFKGIRVLGG